MRKVYLALASSLVLILGACAGSESDSGPWSHRPGGVVQTAQGAITVARAVWIAANPGLVNGIGNEETWQKDFVATLADGVWRVSRKVDPDQIDGGMEILISQKDARLIDMYLN